MSEREATSPEGLPPLKPLPAAAIGMALQKADRYRLLNEPGEAESICRDVLATAPDNAEAVITLVLALTDQFPRGLAVRFDEAMTLAGRLADAFERAYYVALICERRAKLHLRQGTPGCGQLAREWLTQAMARYEEALALRPRGAEKSLLRFNACVRLMGRYAKLLAQQEPPDAPLLSD